MTETALLRIEGLRVAYAETEILGGVELELQEGESVFVLGPNGVGKSTLLRCIAGCVPGQGRVHFDGKDLLALNTRSRIRCGVVLCPEGRRLFGEMSVRENLRLGAFLRRDRHGIEEDLRQLARRIPWLAERMEQPAGFLSGGQQQMVAVARALMARPRLLLLDEPTVGLSPAAIAELREWLGQQSSIHGVTVLGTEQNVVFARDVADRLALLGRHRIQSIAPAAELLPANVGSAAGLADRFFGTQFAQDDR